LNRFDDPSRTVRYTFFRLGTSHLLRSQSLPLHSNGKRPNIILASSGVGLERIEYVARPVATNLADPYISLPKSSGIFLSPDYNPFVPVFHRHRAFHSLYLALNPRSNCLFFYYSPRVLLLILRTSYRMSISDMSPRLSTLK
jgi:hypothetical protein